MPKHLHIAIAIFIIAILASCTMEGPCEGSLTVVRTIPDITMAVGDTVRIDLSNPRIFERPPNNAIQYSFTPINGSNNITLKFYQNTNDENNNSIIDIVSLKSGETRLQIDAGAGCLENSTPLNITVQ